jgi:hypothetical protein
MIKDNCRKILFRILITVGIILSISTDSFSQLIVSTSTVKANFGIEGDAYSNLLQFGTGFTASGTDDWFYRSPGTGVNVIDTTGAAALRAYLSTAPIAGRNFGFQKPMSRPLRSIVNGYQWLDARYYRDNICAGAQLDSTIFKGSSNKNADNPCWWNVGIGSTPAKNDIVDAYIHARRDGILPDDSLWVLMGSSLRTTDGSSYIDFEFFRETIRNFDPVTGFSNMGPDSCHTAWKFDPITGAPNKVGDIIISTNFINGGASYSAFARIWVHLDSIPGGMPTNLINNYNALSGIRFKLTGVFNTGSGSGRFAYAEIQAVDLTKPAAYIWSEGPTTATPWGTLDGSNASFASNYSSRQFVESGVNFTQLGLDIFFSDTAIDGS